MVPDVKMYSKASSFFGKRGDDDDDDDDDDKMGTQSGGNKLDVISMIKEGNSASKAS